jgi:hypothetical protein
MRLSAPLNEPKQLVRQNHSKFSYEENPNINVVINDLCGVLGQGKKII